MSCASERRLPQAQLVDASRDGVLMVLDEPTGFAAGQSVVVSIEPDDRSFVLVADVVRVERGTDFRTYVAVVFRPVAGDELERWAERLPNPDDERGAAAVDDAGDGVGDSRVGDSRVEDSTMEDGVEEPPARDGVAIAS